jgi:hypothetical protein
MGCSAVSADSLNLNQAITGRRPAWLSGIDEPAVRAGVRDKQHKPDWTSDEPHPACGAPLSDDIDWSAEERDESRTQCHHQQCWGTPDTQDGGPPRHVQDAAQDHQQLDLENDRWSQ